MIRPTGDLRAGAARSTWLRASLVVLLVAAVVASIAMGVRTYRTLTLLQSAQAAGVASTSSLRPWMTIQYVAATFRVSESMLRVRLQLPSDLDGRTTLRALAERHRATDLEYLQIVQSAIAAALEREPEPVAADPASSPGWIASTGERLLAAVVTYGYPALALTLFVGALGFPVPSGVATIVAGSLAAQGHLNWLGAAALAVAASSLGDLAAYGLGRFGNRSFIERRGRWFGFTPANRARADMLFLRWGALTVLLSRTLVSHLSSVISLLAGLSRYRLTAFVAVGVLGRVAWTAAYLGLGHSVGADLSAASGFLGSLTGLLFSITIAAGAALLLFHRRAPAADSPAGAGR
jgi:membrane-associated protein